MASRELWIDYSLLAFHHPQYVDTSITGTHVKHSLFNSTLSAEERMATEAELKKEMMESKAPDGESTVWDYYVTLCQVHGINRVDKVVTSAADALTDATTMKKTKALTRSEMDPTVLAAYDDLVAVKNTKKPPSSGEGKENKKQLASNTVGRVVDSVTLMTEDEANDLVSQRFPQKMQKSHLKPPSIPAFSKT